MWTFSSLDLFILGTWTRKKFEAFLSYCWPQCLEPYFRVAKQLCKTKISKYSLKVLNVKGNAHSAWIELISPSWMLLAVLTSPSICLLPTVRPSWLDVCFLVFPLCLIFSSIPPYHSLLSIIEFDYGEEICRQCTTLFLKMLIGSVMSNGCFGLA